MEAARRPARATPRCPSGRSPQEGAGAVNVRQIEALRAVVETGTVSRAALRLRISQPAVTKIIQNLEYETKLILFERRKGGLAPTVECMMLYDEMESVYRGIMRLDRFADDIRMTRHGTMRLGVMPALSAGFIQDVLDGIYPAESAIQVSVHARSSPKIVEWVVRGHLDVGLTSKPVDHPEIATRTLCMTDLVCIMPRGHALARRNVIEPDDLADQSFIAFTRDVELRQDLDRLFDQRGIARHIRFEAPMAPTVCAFVARGLGVSVIARAYLGIMAETVEVRPFVSDLVMPINIVLTYNRPPSLVVQHFIEQASRYLDTMGLSAPATERTHGRCREPQGQAGKVLADL
ncbi:LysR substrate-binding domain-containing protein [Marinivivus vitaminiproducens]|uniref:LysR substrate-binding domain-containing protein n=1 Tax=Marinivivus vitaminiproducens TaxID=3035935 RepID=UPI0027988828|nr:LysR substrate-binding domain-containing protein [Geminicoccaceae bacterium SCSIO 64248]